jgi:hypothetical protein
MRFNPFPKPGPIENVALNFRTTPSVRTACGGRGFPALEKFWGHWPRQVPKGASSKAAQAEGLLNASASAGRLRRQLEMQLARPAAETEAVRVRVRVRVRRRRVRGGTGGIMPVIRRATVTVRRSDASLRPGLVFKSMLKIQI